MGYPLAPILFADEKPFPFAVCDIEAYQWTKFRAIGFYDGQTYNHFNSIAEFFDFLVVEHSPLVEADSKGKKKFKIFAHFGGKYDFNFLLQELLIGLSESWRVGEIIPRGSGMLCFDAYHQDLTVSFYDSSALLPFGLANLTKAFNVQTKKGHFDFEKWDGKVTEELLAYLKDDCVSLHQVLRAFYNWPLIKFSGPAVTMASQSLKVFRTFLKTELYTLNDKADEFVRRSYFGGRTEIFKPYFEKENKNLLKGYDVNSLYPSVMIDNEYPGNMDNYSYNYIGDRMGFVEAEVYVPEGLYVPPLGTVFQVPTKTEEYKKGKKVEKEALSSKFIFPTGTFSGVWSTIELEYAKTLGVKIRKTGKALYFKNAGYLFKEYIHTLYEMRLDAQRKGDGVTDVLTKLLMNSLYGRFGLNVDREILTIDFGQAGVIPSLEFQVKEKVARLCRQPNRINSFRNVAISAWVTSLSRIKMHQHYMKCGEKIWYTDTDSIYTTENLGDSKLLGEMKWERDVKRACFLLPKTYALEVVGKDGNDMKKLVMKGFDKRKIDKFTVDDFLMALEGDMKLLSAEQPEKFCTFRTAMRKGKFVAMMEKSSRSLKTKYDKRRIVRVGGGDYDTIPLHIRDGKVVN